MKVVNKAILDKFTADAALVAKATGGLHLDYAPPETAEPYIIFAEISDSPEDTFTDYGENLHYQFTIVSDSRSSEEADDIFELLKTCYDYCTLVVSGYSHIEMRRLPGSNLMSDPDDGCWRRNVDYRILTQKV